MRIEPDGKVTFHIDNIHRIPQGKPRIKATLRRNRYPRNEDTAFLPMRIPEMASLLIEGAIPSCIRQMRGNFVLKCNPGHFQVALGTGTPCDFEIQSGTQIFIQVEADVDTSDAEPVVRVLDLHFSPPLMIHNLVHTLNQLHDVVTDRALASLRPVWKTLPKWVRNLGELAVGSADSKAVIFLEHASAQPAGRAEPLLRFGFNGKVRWFDQLEVPFYKVMLPSVILPTPFASLTKLLTEQPFATAEIDYDKWNIRRLMRSIRDMGQELEGDLALEIKPPELQVLGETIDTTRFACTLNSPPVILHCREFSATIKNKNITFSCPAVLLGSDEKTDEVQMDLKGKMHIDLEHEDVPLEKCIALDLDCDSIRGRSRSELKAQISTQSPLVRGEMSLPVLLQHLELNGGFALSYKNDKLMVEPSRACSFAGHLHTDSPFTIHRADSQWSGDVKGTFEGKLFPQVNGCWQSEIAFRTKTVADFKSEFRGLPELDLDHGLIEAHLEASLDSQVQAVLRIAPPSFEADLSGSRFAVNSSNAFLELSGRRFTLPPQTETFAHILHGSLTARGPENFAFDLHWDLHGQPFLLHHNGRSVSLLTEDLRRKHLVLHLDETGKLHFAGGPDGFYSVRYFNALINPISDPEVLIDLLKSDDAMAHIVATIGQFNTQWAERLSDLQALWRASQKILKQEGVKEPGDFIPRQMITRIASIMLTGSTKLQEKLEPLFKRVTEGGGLDLVKAKEILLSQLGEFDIDYEISIFLSWFDLVLSPTERLDEATPAPEPPLELNPAYAEARQGIPSAREIYEAIAQKQYHPTWINRLADIAPSLTSNQLAYILERANSIWEPDALARMSYVYEVKRRVEKIAEGYGGFEYLCQPWIIAAFLGEAVGPLPGVNISETEPRGTWPPPTALGPEEVAALLRAGLATMNPMDGRTQLNNRFLLELMRHNSPEFTLEVMVELGQQSPRILSGILYSFLGQDQNMLADPLDLVMLLEDKLGLTIPRQDDYLAGGRRAKASYYEALSRVADEIIDRAAPYLSRKQHIQVMRHDPAPPFCLPQSSEILERKAKEAISRADALGNQCDFRRQKRGGPRKKSRDAYVKAFRACAKLLEHEPRAFQLPWFREFWQRNEEALKVLSVVRNIEQKVDRVPRWLSIQSGKEHFQGEQDLLETVVNTLYWEADDRAKMLADPLTRLLIDPEPGHYHFSIVSCMGVITDGNKGAELEDAYARLEKMRGIRIIRAATGTARSLEYNAKQIIEAIKTCSTPWGFIGYSQGCANALLAESILYGGTPEEQKLLGNLVCRNLIFSAANGSAHGSGSILKFRRAMNLGEQHLKHYQAIYSKQAIEAVLRAFKVVLDHWLFVAVLGGTYSLTYERARVFNRDGQFLDRVPTSYSRGVATRANLPETLEYLYYMLLEQTGSQLQDTQVLTTDAVGHASRVSNEYTETLKRCDMGSYVQFTHHWAPLTKEIKFVTTPRDRQLAVYETPKDRLVWPWVEVNARFGRIKRI